MTKTYRSRAGEARALAESSFSVPAGQFVSIVGPSGCGKSTLLMCIAGLIPCSSGFVTIRQQPVSAPYVDLGLVFQSDLLMQWRNVLDNVLIQGEFRGIPKRALRRRALALLEMVGLDADVSKHPHELSGGMRQRVAICRALLHDPPLLLMDEPFGALDALTRDQLNLELQTIWSETHKTVLFVTHSIPEAIFLADRVLVMSPAPGAIIDDILVGLDRPRRLEIRETPQFGVLAQKVRSTLELHPLSRAYPVQDSR